MPYNNNSSSALIACEKERTGNYGANQYNTDLILYPCTPLPDNFKILKEKDLMTNIHYNYDSKLYEIKNCKILKDLTPQRDKQSKIYLCKCNICGKTFTRSRKTLLFHHSDCGCVQNTGFRSGMYIDRLILNTDTLSKKVMLAKINALNNPNLTDTFNALYISQKPYNEYTALEAGMSMATMYRARKQIHKLWLQLNNTLE